jgi:hypothetical protein
MLRRASGREVVHALGKAGYEFDRQYCVAANAQHRSALVISVLTVELKSAWKISPRFVRKPVRDCILPFLARFSLSFPISSLEFATSEHLHRLPEGLGAA